jgi:hypothetical protein
MNGCLRKQPLEPPLGSVCDICGLGPCREEPLADYDKPLADPAAEPVYCMQSAPYPQILADLVRRLEYRQWKFKLVDQDRGQGSRGLTLIIKTFGYNSYNPEYGETYSVRHFMLVPPAAYNEKSWRWWLFNQCLLVEQHECMEFFKIDGKRPYAPHHGPGNDPYLVFERGTSEEARTMYTGEVL